MQAVRNNKNAVRSPCSLFAGANKQFPNTTQRVKVGFLSDRRPNGARQSEAGNTCFQRGVKCEWISFITGDIESTKKIAQEKCNTIILEQILNESNNA
jgi:hypothetical protein